MKSRSSKAVTASAIAESANRAITAAGLLATLQPKREFDESAQTIAEIAAELKLTRSQAYKLIQANLDRFEQVWKRGSKWPVPAYRPKK